MTLTPITLTSSLVDTPLHRGSREVLVLLEESVLVTVEGAAQLEAQGALVHDMEVEILIAFQERSQAGPLSERGIKRLDGSLRDLLGPRVHQEHQTEAVEPLPIPQVTASDQQGTEGLSELREGCLAPVSVEHAVGCAVG